MTQQYPPTPGHYYPPPPPAPPKKQRKWPYWVGGIFVLLILISVINAGNTPRPSSGSTSYQPSYQAPASQQQPAVAAPSGPLTTFSDGTYEVGVDIDPGQYRTPGSGEDGILNSCYFARRSNDSGDLSAIIANDNFNGPKSVTVKKGEFLEVSRGCVWTKK